MAVEAKDLFVGGKVIVISTDKEFDAYEALVVKVAATRKSALVIRLEHADQYLKEHGATWIDAVLKAEDNDDIHRATLEEMFKPTGDAAKFIQEFKQLADSRVEITKKMEQLANKYSFHVVGEEAKAKKEGGGAKKKTAAKKKESAG